MDINIPTASIVSNALIDAIDSNTSSISNRNVSSGAFIERLATGGVTIRSANDSSIYFRILDENYQLLDYQNRMSISASGDVLISYDEQFRDPQSKLSAPHGDLMIDFGFGFGTFDTNKVLQQGLIFNQDSFDFVPNSVRNDDVVFNHDGLAIRQSNQHVLDIFDTQYASMRLVGDQSNIYFDYGDIRYWSILSQNDALILRDQDFFNIFTYHQHSIGINTVIDSDVGVNIDGNIQIIGSQPFQFTNAAQTGLNTFLVTDDLVSIASLDDLSGINFNIDGQQFTTASPLTIRDHSVGIHDAFLNSEYINYSFIVNGTSYFSQGLVYQQEPVRSKTIETDDGVVLNDVSHIQFSYDSGFDIEEVSDYHARLLFQSHFSTINIKTLNSNNIYEDSSEFVVPKRFDNVQFLGEGLVFESTDVDAMGSLSEMDSIRVYSELKDGGEISGNIQLNGSVVADYLIGDASQIDNLPFPFRHISTTNRETEYVLTANVGISTQYPTVALEVNGDASFNAFISPEINVYGDLSALSSSLSFGSEDDMVITVNQSIHSLVLNDLVFHSSMNIGLNDVNDLYQFSVYSSYIDSLVLLESNDQPNISFYQNDDIKGVLYLNFDDLVIGAAQGVNQLMVTVADQSVFHVSSSKKVGIGLTPTASIQNYLDVSGNMVIGSGFAGNYVANNDSVMVESMVGVGTVDPVSSFDVVGSMIVSDKNTVTPVLGSDGNLIVDTQLLINQDSSRDLSVNGAIGTSQSLYFGDTLLQFGIYHDFIDDDIIIGYDLIPNRTLHFKSPNDFTFSTFDQSVGFSINSMGNMGLGLNPSEILSNFHIKHSEATVLIESSLDDAQLLFNSNGLIGFDASMDEKFDSSLSSSESSYFIIRGDTLSPDTNGAPFQMDRYGQVDIAYNMNNADSDALKPTQDVALDIAGDIVSEKYYVQSGSTTTIVTSMPIGSIIMWSGWATELPEGWKFCGGEDTDTSTSKCNMKDRFMMAKNDEDSSYLRHSNQIGAHMVTLESNPDSSIVEDTDYIHTHTNSHEHSLTQLTHSHSSDNLPPDNSSYTSIATAPSYYTSTIGDILEDFRSNSGKMKTKENGQYIMHQFTSGTSHAHQVSNKNHTHTVSYDSHSHSHVFSQEDSTHGDSYHSHDNLETNLSFIHLHLFT